MIPATPSGWQRNWRRDLPILQPRQPRKVLRGMRSAFAGCDGHEWANTDIAVLRPRRPDFAQPRHSRAGEPQYFALNCGPSSTLHRSKTVSDVLSEVTQIVTLGSSRHSQRLILSWLQVA
jgi:hypothetical protein